MRQQLNLFLLLILTIGVPKSHSYGHGIKGSFSKSFSSSSASASSSAFSNSFSSNPSDLSEGSNGFKTGSAAFSTAFANADANGAKAGSGAYAGSGSDAFSNSGAFAGSSAGSFSGSSSYGGSGAISGANSGPGAIPGANSGSGAISGGNSGSGALPVIKDGSGAVPFGTGLVSGHGANSGAVSGSVANSGAISDAGSYGSGKNTGSGTAGCSGGSYSGCAISGNAENDNNIRYNNINDSPNNVRVNDFNIPESEYENKGEIKYVFPGPAGNIHDSKPPSGGSGGSSSWSQTQNYGSGVSNQNGDSYKPGGCASCKGPFPGPKGSIHDYVAVPAEPVSHPQPISPPVLPREPQPQLPLVRPSSGLFSKLPGPSGSIYDSKPVAPGGVIPVAVIPVVISGPETHNQPTYQQAVPQPKPGSIAVAVSGQFPGPGGNIHSSAPVGQNTYKPQAEPHIVPTTYDKRPAPPSDLIHSLPGNPGSIYDSKPVSGSNARPGIDLSIIPSPPRRGPDCTQGQCDEYGGRLGCHGDECFGPGKRPDYVQSGSQSKANANSNFNQQSGNIDVNLHQPKPDCSKGQCNVNGAYHPQEQLPGKPGKTCSGIECLKHVDQVTEHPKLDFDIEIRHPKPEYGPKEPEYPTGYHHSGSNSKSDAESSSGQVKIDVYTEIPEVPLEPVYETHPKASTPEPAGNKPSMDFLLPGNKPYHPHRPKPHHPKPVHENKPEPAPETKYYTCTGSSCKLPKPTVPELTPTVPSHPCKDSSCHQSKPPCHGDKCGTPSGKPGCPGGFCIPDEYKGAGGKDRLYPPPFIAPVDYNTPSEPEKIDYNGKPKPEIHPGKPGSPPPFIVPVGYDTPSKHTPHSSQGVDRLSPPSFIPPGGYDAPLEPEKIDYNVGPKPGSHVEKPGGYSSGINAGANFNKETNSAGFVSGNVVVQKNDGAQVPVVDVLIPGGQPCQGLGCDRPVGGVNSGGYSGSFLGQTDRKPCSGDKCNYPGNNGGYSGSAGTYSGSHSGAYSGSGSNQPCAGGKCDTPNNHGAYLGGHSGGYSGSEGKKHGELCGNGNCGHGIEGVQFGGQSGSHSGSFSGSSNYAGVKGGCKTCGDSPKNSGAYSGSGAFSGSSAYSGASSGAFSGSSSGSYSSASSGTGPEASLDALKQLLTKSLKETGFGGSGSFAKSGAVAGSGGGSSSAFSSAYSSAGSTSY